MKLFNTFFRSILASLGIAYDNHVFNHSIKYDLNESTKEYDDYPNIKSTKKENVQHSNYSFKQVDEKITEPFIKKLDPEKVSQSHDIQARIA